MNYKEKIAEIADGNADHIIEVREKIHANPELSFKEFKTSDLVRQELTRIGIKFEDSPIQNGIIGEIDSGKPGKLLMLRADMDALPIQEEVDSHFKSTCANVMHACGHDIHTSNLIAVGQVLHNMKEHWTGKVKLVFQPAEESGGGGNKMIKAGLMDEMPDACLAIHVVNNKLGHIIAGSKYLTSYSDRFHVTIKGKAAHSSSPEKGVDAIGIAVATISTLNSIVGKNINPLDSTALNIGKISGGTAPNIIADQVVMDMMMRNKSPISRERMASRIEKICHSTASMLDGSCEIDRIVGYDAVYNDEDLTDFIVDTIDSNQDFLYKKTESLIENIEYDIKTGDQLDLKSEDFGFYSQKASSTLLWVGLGEGADLHNPNFFIDSKNIIFATKLMTLLAFEYLNSSE